MASLISLPTPFKSSAVSSSWTASGALHLSVCFIVNVWTAGLLTWSTIAGEEGSIARQIGLLRCDSEGEDCSMYPFFVSRGEGKGWGQVFECVLKSCVFLRRSVSA